MFERLLLPHDIKYDPRMATAEPGKSRLRFRGAGANHVYSPQPFDGICEEFPRDRWLAISLLLDRCHLHTKTSSITPWVARGGAPAASRSHNASLIGSPVSSSIH